MFHLMLVLPALVVLAFIVSALLFSILTLVLSAVGGASTALFIKDKSLKKLLFIGFCILSFVGLICLIPFITLYLQLPELFFTLATVIALICIAGLSLFGIKLSTAMKNKIGKTILISVFSLILSTAASFAIFIPIVRGFLLSP
jgi:hypothetical protein